MQEASAGIGGGPENLGGSHLPLQPADCLPKAKCRHPSWAFGEVKLEQMEVAGSLDFTERIGKLLPGSQSTSIIPIADSEL